MDLSGLIFVVLAVAWAGYLIPRALRHHEQVAANRPVESFSDTMRVLERTPATMRALLTPPGSPVEAADRTASKAKRKSERAQLREIEKARLSAVSRPTTRGAAVRRRRVLLVLAVLTALTGGASGLAYLPRYAAAVPGALVLGWLVLCVLMARRSRLAQRRPVAVRRVGPVDEPAKEDVVDAPAPAPVATPAAAAESVESDDDGSLWDPLPLTLPTYVTKPAARRTVRTIDLTQTGVTSSGHQAADSKLARAAEAGAKAATAKPEQAPVRRAAGA